MAVSKAGQLIFQARVAKTWTRAELHRRSGIKGSTIAAIENGQTQQPSAAIIGSLANALGLDSQVILEAARRRTAVVSMTCKVPVLKMTIGEPLPAQPFTKADIQGHLNCDVKPEAGLFAITMSGASMQSMGELSIPDGAIVVFAPVHKPDDVDAGDCVLVQYESGQTAFGQLQFNGRDNPHLRPLNPQYPIVMESFEVIGVAAEVRVSLK